MLNIEKTVMSQFANSATLMQLIENFNEYVDPRANMRAFYDCLWNVDTAFGAFLDIWGRIVGVSRVLHIPNDVAYLGFANSSIPQDWQTFGHGVFYSGNRSSQTYSLPDATYRTLILAKALSNITATNARGLNALLRLLFPGRGRAYTIDNGGMSMTFVFEFALTAAEYAILAGSGVLPHPAGVGYNVVVIPSLHFGFIGDPSATPFNHAPFFVRQ